MGDQEARQRSIATVLQLQTSRLRPFWRARASMPVGTCRPAVIGITRQKSLLRVPDRWKADHWQEMNRRLFCRASSPEVIENHSHRPCGPQGKFSVSQPAHITLNVHRHMLGCYQQGVCNRHAGRCTNLPLPLFFAVYMALSAAMIMSFTDSGGGWNVTAPKLKDTGQ